MSTELALLDKELNALLRNSLYPNASDQSLELVKGYCKASGYDIMRKPVHIVPMWNSAAGRMQDTIMPSIGLYRTDAARTGEYAGISEPVFGPVVTRQIGNLECTFPEWCKITVKRKVGNIIAEFTSQELWIESYAPAGGKEKLIQPNSMWMKRPYGQLRKCAEAQALRMAFPEVGSQPTAEEMEGKEVVETEKVINPMPEQPVVKTALSFSELKTKLESAGLNDLDGRSLKKIDFNLYSKDEGDILRQVVIDRRAALQNNVVADIPKQEEAKVINWAGSIKVTKTLESLINLVESMPDDVQAQFEPEIQAQQDKLRGVVQ